MTEKIRKNQKGYIALIALLLIAAAGLTIGISVSLGGIDEVQSSYANEQAAKAKFAANTCIEEGLERLRKDWNNYSATLSVGPNSCIIRTVVDVTIATVYATGTVDIYTQKIEVQVDNDLDVINWQEE